MRIHQNQKTALVAVPKPKLTVETFVRDVVPSMPQGKYIEPTDASAWFKAMIEREPERIEWHIRRLHGIGGSEIGEIAAAALGLSTHFKTVPQIIGEKLMRLLPEAPTRAMRRGIDMETIARKWFYSDFGARPVSGAAERINRTSAPGIPWMRGNVDDVVELGGKVYIVDYKCSADPKTESPLVYSAQLHQYDYIYAVSKGIAADDFAGRETPMSVDGFLNVYLDYVGGTVVAVAIPYEPDLMEAIISGGNAVYKHITSGDPLPEWPKPPAPVKVSMSEQAEGDLATLEASWLQAKLIADAAKDRVDDLSRAITATLRSHAPNPQGLVKGAKYPLQVGTVTTRQSIDKEHLEEMLASRAQAVADSLKSPGKDLDMDRLADFLDAHGSGIEGFMEQVFDLDKVVAWAESEGLELPLKETISLSVNSRKKDITPLLSAAKEQATALVDVARSGLIVSVPETQAA